MADRPRVRVRAGDATGASARAIPSLPAVPSGNGRRRTFASLDGSAPEFFPYDSANWYSAEMGDWLPWIRSPDNETTVYRDRMVARQRDLVRNDAWAAGSINRILDSTVGSDYRLLARPDWRALAVSVPTFDSVWAEEFADAAEALWRTYSKDIGHYNDAARQMTVSQQFRLMLRHKLIDGEALATVLWLPERIGPSGAHYATAFQVVDPDLLSNPYQMVDTRYLRGGVEIDDLGVAEAYHIRRAHQNDWYNAVESMEWERVPAADPDGFRRVIHDYDRDRSGQHRGVSIFAPVVTRMKMLARYYGVELQAATLASVFGTFITSPYDPAVVEEAMEDRSLDYQRLNTYQDLRAEFHDAKSLMLAGARIPTLAPGEKIESVSVARPHGEFSPFTHEMLRCVAAALGISAEQVTQDYSETNYSSARAAIVEAEKTFKRRCEDFTTNTALPFYAAWLHEVFDRNELPLPTGAPSYLEMRTAYAGCRWLGTARGWVDPVAERQGAILGLDAAFSTLEEECAQQGQDWEDNLRQRARERALMNELGLPHPEWMGQAVTATMAAEKPQKPAAA